MLKQFPPPRDYSSLSVRDLLDARDAYHTHLTHLQNVVATAIGLYRFRETDYYATHAPASRSEAVSYKPNGKKSGNGPKTLSNSLVKAWSWPCVLVFVSAWLDKKIFMDSPDQMVPRALYLPDGRVIPTCVITLQDQAGTPPQIQELSFARNRIGGGCAIVSDVQGKEHVASLGCLVSDGRTVYALTNKHVAGDAGTTVYTSVRGQRERIGKSAVLQRGKIPFEEAYSGWPGTNALVNMDVGLIEVDDLNAWTPAIVGLGELGEPLDLNPDSITLDLIDCPVRAYGGASGWLFGRIDALFYRYKAMGGSEYVADFLIAPARQRPKHAPEDVKLPTQTRPGDSGTLWCLDWTDPATKEFEIRPLGLQWGGHVFSDGARIGAQSYALATNFATICRELDIDLVRDWANRLPEYWGDVGHYTIAAKACEIVENRDLRTLLDNNLERISYSDEDLTPATFKGLSKAKYVPLADVPDKVWKMHGQGARGGPEHPEHFADMDKPDADGKNLLDLTASRNGKDTDPQKATLDVFESYYKDIKDRSKGVLPFRVEQLFQIMIETKKVEEFVAAAGVTAHYVGDACQPLHISYLNNGYPDGRGNGVHEAYESKMLNGHAAEVLQDVNDALKAGGGTHGLPLIKTPRDARITVIQLMRETLATLPPKNICDAYIADPASLWQQFRSQTIDVIVSGVRTLAMIYDSAWAANPSMRWSLAEISEAALRAYYLKKAWAPSKTINQIAVVLDSGGK